MLEGGHCPFIQHVYEKKEYFSFRKVESTWRFFTLPVMIVFANCLAKKIVFSLRNVSERCLKNRLI